ncbi:MAG TPA: SLBB domain-containing protein [Acidobacteriaceae bacterium]|nr:SLBB domain-containing protein [Acidobacteriaceae bacterium]
MGKRSAFYLATLLVAGIAVVQSLPASAQISDTTSPDCPGGIVSPVDGTCVSADQSLAPDQQPGPQTGGAYGAVPSGQSPLAQQYPGLQSSQGMNARVPIFNDRSGMTSMQARQQALYEAQALALQSYQPPTEFQELVRGSLGEMLPVYGDSLFRRVPSTFSPLWETPVTPEYVLGPGDQLVIRIWGQVNFNAQLTVDRSGSVYLPQVGEIHVAGLPYSQLQQHLRDEVSRIYKNFNLNVELGQLRSIQVFVVGQARRPGTYTLSSLSTLVTALFATGGPSVQGSLRDIQVKRSGEVITHFDLYDLLVKGEKSKDVPLLAGDVIYIPPVGPQVAVGGSVRNRAIYELKGPTDVKQLFEFAGGLSTTASLLRASIERIDAHKERTTEDISLEGAGMNTPLQEGDILYVLPISPKFQNTVTLRGNVAVPGRFTWHPGMKLSDILPNTESLITRDYWERRNQLGIPGPEFKPEYAMNPDLYPRNANGYRSTPQLSRYPMVPNTQGQPNANPAANQYNPNAGVSSYPNTGPIAGDTGQFSNYPSQPGSYDQSSPYNQSAPGENCDPNASQGQYLNGQMGNNQPNAQDAQQSNLPPCIYPGNATQSTSSRTRNLPRPPLNVTLPVPEIDWSYAAIERFNPQNLTTSLIPFNLGQLVMNHDASQDLALQAGDVVTIFSQADIRVPQAQRTKYVRLEGEFKHAGIYSVQPGETLRDLVIRAGGLTPDAYLFGSDFTRESTRVIQQQRLNDYLSHLEVQIDASTALASANSVTPQDATATQAEVAASRSLVARFRLLRATGRIVLNIPHNAADISQIPAIPLEDGDQFTIPSRPSTVNVVGSVYNQNSFIYQQSRAVGTYLRLAGGSTGDADNKHTFVIRADGSVVSKDTQNGIFGNTFASMRLDPGDTVVVPEKVPKATILRNMVNYTQIFSQIALGAAAVAIL